MVILIVTSVLLTPFSSAHSDASAAVGRPNIIVFVTDDQTVESFGKMTYLNSRPNLVRFTNAWVNSALCCPSRATILSGRYDTHTRVEHNAQGWQFDDQQTIATWLRRAGYRTGLIGKYLNGTGNPMEVPPGWDDWQSVWPNGAGYAQYDYTMNVNGSEVRYGARPQDYEVDVLANRARTFVRKAAASGKPFLLYFSPTATHGPFVAGPRESGMFDEAPVTPVPAFNEADVSDKPQYVRNLDRLSADDMATDRRRQWAASVSVDRAYRAIDEQLQASGAADNTVVIILSDNGFAFGAHRWYAKMCQYSACLQVPMAIRLPGTASRSIDRYVSNVDVASTVAELAGVAPGIPQDGQSLLPLVRGEVTGWRNNVLQHWTGGDNVGKTGHGIPIPEYWAVRGKHAGQHWAYVELATGERELYDLRRDPHELRNIAGQSAYRAVQDEMRARLVRLKDDALRVHAGVDDRPLPPAPHRLWIDEYAG